MGDAADCCVEYGVEELLLVAKVGVDQRFADASFLGDAVDPRAGETEFRELDRGGVKEALFGALDISHTRQTIPF